MKSDGGALPGLSHFRESRDEAAAFVKIDC